MAAMWAHKAMQNAGPRLAVFELEPNEGTRGIAAIGAAEGGAKIVAVWGTNSAGGPEAAEAEKGEKREGGAGGRPRGNAEWGACAEGCGAHGACCVAIG